MKYHYFFNTIRKVIIQFLNMFNDIQIARYNDEGEIIKYIKVPLRFVPKEKMFHWITQKRFDKVFPTMSVQLNGIQLDTDRITNKSEKIGLKIDEEVKRVFNPTPYTLNFQLNIASKFMVDQDQILEQILPFFTPNSFIIIEIPELGVELENKVLFESCNMDRDANIDEAGYRMIVYTLDFRVQTYLFNPLISTTKIYLTMIYVDENGNEIEEELVLEDGVHRYVKVPIIDDDGNIEYKEYKIEIKDCCKVYINDVRHFDVYYEENGIEHLYNYECEFGKLYYFYINNIRFEYYCESDNIERVIKKLITKYYGNKKTMLEFSGTETQAPSGREQSLITNIITVDDKSDPLFNIYQFERFDEREKETKREWKEKKED